MINEIDKISERLHTDPEYSSFEAMRDTSIITDQIITDRLSQTSANHLLAGGSLGRSEMLPNSDIDLFVVSDDWTRRDREKIEFCFNKTEFGVISRPVISKLISLTLVDGNRLADLRAITGDQNGDFRNLVKEANITDRQVSNIIAEWFYFRYFDYPSKQHEVHGPNIKYSNGSSRDTIFIDWFFRLKTGLFPSSDFSSSTPEILKASRFLDIPNPVMNAVDLIQVVKNATVQNYTDQADWRLRYLNNYSLEGIYQICKQKFVAQSIGSSEDLGVVYNDARRKLEDYVDNLVKQTIGSFSNQNMFTNSTETLMDRLLESSQSADITTLSWLFSLSRPNDLEVEKAFTFLKSVDFPNCWGGLMALLCIPSIKGDTLRDIGEWLYAHEPGAYLIKLAARNANSSPVDQHQLRQYYAEKEIIK